jgi:predicted nuclease of restriction endonuclease-like RecB superfamily
LSYSNISLILGIIVLVVLFLLISWIIDKIKKYRKNKFKPQLATTYKCLDGHLVRSKGELIIDNHLHRLGIDHEYEKTIRIKSKLLKYDWYLPGFQIYIEYWGYYGKEYMKRKAEKLQLYHKGNLKLISIEDIMLKDIYFNLERELSKIVKFKEFSELKQHCPNCGLLLDERFVSKKLRN